MTFQVGIVGTDGVLLAGDQRYTDFSGGFRTGSQSSKIRVQGSVAYCSSGSELASGAAEYCLDALLPNCDVGELLFEGCRVVLEQCDKPKDPQGSILFVCRSSEKSELWFIDVRANLVVKDVVYPCLPQRIGNHKRIGDENSAAAFFLERYLPIEPESSVADLRLVAAHTVLTAGMLNSGGVGGLEMMLCRDGDQDYERMEGAQLNDLKSRSRALDSAIELKLRGAP